MYKTTYFWVVQDTEGFYQGIDTCSALYRASRNVWFPTVERFETFKEANRLACAYGKDHSYRICKLSVLYTVE